VACTGPLEAPAAKRALESLLASLHAANHALEQASQAGFTPHRVAPLDANAVRMDRVVDFGGDVLGCIPLNASLFKSTRQSESISHGLFTGSCRDGRCAWSHRLMCHASSGCEGPGYVARFAARAAAKIVASAGPEAAHQAKRPLLDHLECAAANEGPPRWRINARITKIYQNLEFR
jgi:hypothetical protein